MRSLVVVPFVRVTDSVASAVCPPLSSCLTVTEAEVFDGSVADTDSDMASPSACFVAVVSDPLVSNGIIIVTAADTRRSAILNLKY